MKPGRTRELPRLAFGVLFGVWVSGLGVWGFCGSKLEFGVEHLRSVNCSSVEWSTTRR